MRVRSAILAGTALALLGGAQDRYQRLFNRVTFSRVAPQNEEEGRVLAVVTQKEHWLGAFRTIEEKLGPFPDAVIVEVSFDLEGESPSSGGVEEGKGVVRFNLPRLVAYQKKADEAKRQIDELARQGKRAVYRVPPLRFDRLIYHELTHVLQGRSDAPEWFTEGMACWIGDDMNYLCGFAYLGKKLGAIDECAADESYARGHVFWKWLATKGATRKVAEAVILKKSDWRRAIEEATGMAWEKAVAAEKEWSAKQVDTLRPKK